MVFSGIALLIGAVVVSVIAETTARGRVSVNGGAGIRIPSVMASEQSWQGGHRAARPYLHATAGALGLAALCAIFAPTTLANIALLGGMAIGIASLAAGTVAAHRAAKKINNA